MLLTSPVSGHNVMVDQYRDINMIGWFLLFNFFSKVTCGMFYYNPDKNHKLKSISLDKVVLFTTSVTGVLTFVDSFFLFVFLGRKYSVGIPWFYAQCSHYMLDLNPFHGILPKSG